MAFLNNCKTFRKLMTNDCIMVPGAFNGMSARIAAENGNNYELYQLILSVFKKKTSKS